MAAINYLTPEGLQKLKEEVNYLTTHARADISKQIAEAREKGDVPRSKELGTVAVFGAGVASLLVMGGGFTVGMLSTRQPRPRSARTAT